MHPFAADGLRFASGVAFAIALLAWCAPETAAAPTTRGAEPQQVWVTDGTVDAITATPQGVFAGGDFNLVGPETGTWAQVSASGAVPRVRTPVEGAVYGAVSDGRGGWYLAGASFYVDGGARRGLIHIRANGRFDKRWRPRINGAVLALVRVRSTLYVGGGFTRFGHTKRLHLAALDAATGKLKRWAPRVTSAKKDDLPASVSALAAARDGKIIYVGGSFARLGRKRRANLGAVDAVHGSIRRWRPRVTGDVHALAVDPRGRAVYAGGDFAKAGGKPRSGLAAFDLRKGHVTRWDPDCDGSISQILPAPSGSPIYVAGSFASIGGKSRRGVAAVNRTRGAATSWDPSVSGSVAALLLASGQHTVFVGGEFDSVGDADRSNLAAIDTRTGSAGSWNPQAIGDVGVLVRIRPGVIGVGGSFSSVGAVRRPRLALFGLDGSLSTWAPELGGTAVRAIAASPGGGRIYIGGRFTLGDRTARSLAVIDPGTLTLSAWGPPVNSGVWAIAPSPDGQTVYVGGAFTSTSGQVRRRLAAYDANGALTSWNPGANGLVKQLILSGDQIWAAGGFGSIGGSPHKGVASLDLATGLATGWDAGPDGTVNAIAVANDSVFVGGEFEAIGGRSRKYLAELDAGDGSARRWDPSPDDYVNGLQVSPDGKTLVVVGDFVKISGAFRDIGEFDLATGFLTAWRPAAPFLADALAFSPDSSTIYVGGEGVFAVYR